MSTNKAGFSHMHEFSYVIITPVYNEEKHIEATILGVLAQTLPPIEWIVVDDGSTDRTARIIKRYASKSQIISYYARKRNPANGYFGSNVAAINLGLQHTEKVEFDFLAFLDADISLPSDYYLTIISRMFTDRRLGIASGIYLDKVGTHKLRRVLNDRRSIPKALSVFRRECFKDIDGFIPLRYGGEDTIACFCARMNGWKTWSFPDVVAVHNKPAGRGQSKSLLSYRFRSGIGEYYMGMHPLFVVVKSLRRCIKEQPWGIGGIARMIGYAFAVLHHEERQIPHCVIKFLRREQIRRIVRRNKIPKEYLLSPGASACHARGNASLR